MEINYYKRTIQELRENVELPFQDPHHIMSSMSKGRKNAVLNNPSGCDDTDICQILALDGNVVVGVTNPFPGRLLINGEIVSVQNGSNLFSHEDYRKMNVGGELFLKSTKLHPLGNNLRAGISQMALPLYRAMKYSVFEFPRVIYLKKSRSVVQAFLHSEGWWTKLIVGVADSFLWLHQQMLNLHNALCYGSFIVEEVKLCPDEVEKIVLQDKHPYMELHDKAWFNWSLNYSFSEDERTKRKLYVVKRKGNVEAFFLTKQEFFKQASGRGFKNVCLGSVMEWGIDKQSKLQEKGLVLLTLHQFERSIDGIQYATNDESVVRQLKRWLFVKIGAANMAIRLRGVKDEAVKDINNWRIRLAASDTVIN